MLQVSLTLISHNKKDCIAIRFNYDRSIQDCVRTLKGIKWSDSNSCWYLPYSAENVRAIENVLPGTVELHAGQLKGHEEKVEIVKPVNEISGGIEKEILTGKYGCISIENLEALRQMMEILHLKAYSQSTIKTYKNELSQLLILLKSRPVSSLMEDDLKRYILYCVDTLQLSENTIHSRLNALKFYFEQVLKREKFFIEIPRPKKHFQLPKILGEREIGKLFNALENKKHKAILFTAYSAGLRVSEVVRLQIKDIDSDRMQIFVEKAKGKKDRYVMLSPVLLDILRSYIKTYNPRPKTYLFEGYEPGSPLSSRAAQNIFLQAKRKAGLKKELSFHSLRHSFATHLLENGVDIKYIKELLGHFSIHTTNRYLHVKREKLVNIISPLDAIYKSGDMDF